MSLQAVSEDIRALLNGSLGLVEAIDLFSFEWGSVDGTEINKQVLVIDLEPMDTDMKDSYEKPVFQILVRGENDESGKIVHDQARAIYDFIREQVTQTINSVDYLEFEPVGGLMPLGKDSNGLHTYAMTFYTFRDPI